MGEALLIRKGEPYDPDAPKLKWVMHTDIITSNSTYVVPNGIRNGELVVTVFGGGGGHFNASARNGYYGGGGGGGYMNRNTISISPGTSVSVTIGHGGTVNNSGGTTSFGTWIAANGGGAGYYANGGNGGSGGGAGGFSADANGGDGQLFGGGGCAICKTTFLEYGNYANFKSNGSASWGSNTRPGYGGTYGGDGGYGIGYVYYSASSIPWYVSSANTNAYDPSPNRGHGGIASFYNNCVPNVQYCTNGDTLDNNAQLLSTGLPLTTTGLAGTTAFNNYGSNRVYGFGGGGGLGGCGGSGAVNISDATTMFRIGGGGGGGYGANGGNACAGYSSGTDGPGACGGGGGGYGSVGTDGYCNSTTGYYYAGTVSYGGGGGGYGPSNYGRGSNKFNAATSGVCIIQYQIAGYE